MNLGARTAAWQSGTREDVPYLCFTANGASAMVSLLKSAVSQLDMTQFEMSLDGATWTSIAACSLGAGEKVYFRNKNDTYVTQERTETRYPYFSMVGSVAISGDIFSMASKTLTAEVKESVTTGFFFYSLFANSSASIDASGLVIDESGITTSGFRRLFYGDANLTAAPDLSGVSLANSIFREAFYGCTSLTSMPEIPTAGGANYCFYSMFQNSGIVNASIVEDVAALYKCQNMFSGCTSLKKLTMRGFGSKYAWRELDTLVYNCTALEEIDTDLTVFNGDRIHNWVDGVPATGTFRCPTALGTDATISRGVNACPEGWTVVNTD